MEEVNAIRMPDSIRHMMMKLKNKDYLPVSARVLWFRLDHPTWGIETEALSITEDTATFRTSIVGRTEEGEAFVISQATKREDVRGFPDFVEKAETGSVGRALALAGYGTLTAEDDASFLETDSSPAAKVVDTPQATRPKPRQATKQPEKPVEREEEVENEAVVSDGNATVELDGGRSPVIQLKMDEVKASYPDPFEDNLVVFWEMIEILTKKKFTEKEKSKWPVESYCLRAIETFRERGLEFPRL